MTKIRQSKELTAFYNAYNDWLEAGAPEENEYNFSRHKGLCSSIYHFCQGDFDLFHSITPEQTILFRKANLDKYYPFGGKAFVERMDENTNHLDPNRIAWVKAHLTEEVDMEFTLQ